MIKRPSAKLIAEIPPGWKWRLLCNGELVLTHPDHPPRIVRLDGKIEELKPQ